MKLQVTVLVGDGKAEAPPREVEIDDLTAAKRAWPWADGGLFDVLDAELVDGFPVGAKLVVERVG